MSSAISATGRWPQSLRQASELRDGKIRKRVLGLTEGVMVRICRLLEAAAIQAIETAHEHINLQLSRTIWRCRWHLDRSGVSCFLRGCCAWPSLMALR